MYTLDTNTIIYYLQGDPKVTALLENIVASNTSLCISVITELELLSFASLTPSEITRIKLLLETIKIKPVDSDLAQLAASIRRQYKIKTPDSIIAATAITTNTTLVTRNIRDFIKVKSLTLLAV